MLSKNTPIARQSWLTDIVSLAFIILAFYLLWLGSYSLFTPDEGRYSEVAREMIATGDYITPRVDGVAFLDKPILYYWLQAASIHIFGIKEWALRLFPVLLGVLGCIVTYVCGRHLFDRRTGIISAVILATTPLYFGGAHYANLDLEVAVLITCTLLFLITGFQSKTNARHYFFFTAYLSAALAFLTKGLIAVAFPAMISGMWIILLWRWDVLKRIHLVPGLLLFIAIVTPWYILVQKANPEFLHYFFVTQQVTRFLSAAEFNNPTPFWFYLPIVLTGFFPWTSFLVQALHHSIRRTWQAREEHPVELFLLLWLTIIFLFFSIPRSKTISYILPVFPALALLTGHYLSLVWKNARQRPIYWAIINFIVIGVLISTVLLTMPQHQLLELPPGFTPYRVAIAVVYIIGSLASLLCLRQKQLLPLFAVCAACSSIFLLTLTMGAEHLNQTSAKPLVTELKAIIKPQDEVITYFKYYQDVPLYLERRVTIVANWNSPKIQYRDNWMRELWYGMSFQKTDDWLIDEDKFWKRWNSSNRVFVFLNENYLDQFKKHATSYYILGVNNDIFLLSNKPTLLSMAAVLT